MTDRQTLRTLTRGVYDLQKLRIESGNRLCANFRSKLGLLPGVKPEETPRVLQLLSMRYKLITDGIAGELTKRKKYVYDGVISDFAELCLVSQYLDLVDREKRHMKHLEAAVKEHPMWDAFFKDAKGCGPTMAAVLLSEVDISKCPYPSSLRRYAGIDVGPDGRGRSRRKEHLVDVEYEDKEGNVKTKKSITYNPFLKAKLMGVLADVMIRFEGPYRTVYDDYKHRLENRPDLAEATKARRHRMALRYMIQRFLSDMYYVWRPLEGLPTAEEYYVAKLGMKKHGEAA